MEQSVSVQILSARELRHMSRRALETHKSAVCLAAILAPTEFHREPYRVQAELVNSILNEQYPPEVYH